LNTEVESHEAKFWCGQILPFCQTLQKTKSLERAGEKLIETYIMLPISSNIVNILLLPLSSRLIGSICYNKHGENMAEINKRLGINIRRYREMKGWSQEQLALEADLHRAYIGQIERGEKNIGLVNLEKIANALNIHLKNLLG
jgi:DNA-binding XRE family transcriptional regulator